MNDIIDKPKRIVVYPIRINYVNNWREQALTYGKTYDVIRWVDSDARYPVYPVVICDQGHEYHLESSKWEAAL